ncbi:hypothetical protein O3P69_004278 [Scylla paramamosain]|uniref:Uncharacterized protein n=1 Tax=Scylla paramamosain TaxID=85552 RepID=A0AAW0ULL2_SCYPA
MLVEASWRNVRLRQDSLLTRTRGLGIWRFERADPQLQVLDLECDESAKEERAASGSLVDGTDVFSNAKLVVQCDGE